MAEKNEDDITAALRRASKDNRLTCERARQLARELNVSLGEIGARCNALGIKISACQLGCF